MVLELDAVSKRFKRPDGVRVALDNVSLALERGQVVGVFGPSGAGKTTLLRVAAGLSSPDSGTVSYSGERFDQMSATQRTRFRRRDIACVWTAQAWQEQLSVLDHVALPLLVDGCSRRSADRKVREALFVTEADHCAGLELHDLSDGECQRVAIARALVTEPRLLLADGPTSRLSLAEQESIMILLSALARQGRVAILITASDAGTLLRADPVLYMRDGKLIGDEPAEEAGKLYRFPAVQAG
jgi:putative ABC transport system ATP-binding protein